MAEIPTQVPVTVNVTAVRVSSLIDPLMYIPEDESLEAVTSDVVRMAAAGHGLALAIYHSSKDEVLAMPKRVLDAYARACSVYGVSR